MSLKEKMQSLEGSTLWENVDDVVKFDQIKEMIKSEFLKLKSNLDWIQI